MKYLDPAVALAPLKADPATPGSGASFGNPEQLVWIEEDLKNIPDGTARIWDALYDTIRLGKKYPIELSQAAKVIEVIEKVKDGTVFANS